MTTLTVQPGQPAEQCTPFRPIARAPAGIDPCAPPMIAVTVMHVIPVRVEVAAASFAILGIIISI